ncbi:hypothetical protein FEP63_00649 [Burkholderia multivorans]|nr:hypothetical protein [Burkholderia multivorans]MDR8883746.1 hypothetical protein [Burkholderia multivorans]MDR8885012.1 hypothetical protein [Burkholderia multivorans]MDR8892817.1 hypothetical protein [Burkholderia multivorans]MDR8899331.1 hypothetical protein [Burkholderia multivorans]
MQHRASARSHDALAGAAAHDGAPPIACPARRPHAGDHTLAPFLHALRPAIAQRAAVPRIAARRQTNPRRRQHEYSRIEFRPQHEGRRVARPPRHPRRRGARTGAAAGRLGEDPRALVRDLRLGPARIRRRPRIHSGRRAAPADGPQRPVHPRSRVQRRDRRARRRRDGLRHRRPRDGRRLPALRHLLVLHARALQHLRKPRVHRTDEQRRIRGIRQRAGRTAVPAARRIPDRSRRADRAARGRAATR